MRIKVQEGKHQQMTQHGLVKLILEDSICQLRIPIMWTTFVDMNREDLIQAIEYERDPTSGGEEEEEETKQEEQEEPKRVEEGLEEEEHGEEEEEPEERGGSRDK